MELPQEETQDKKGGEPESENGKAEKTKSKEEHTTIVVKHVPLELQDTILRKLFEEYGGEVVDLKMNRSMSLAFVTYKDVEGAGKSIRSLNGFKLLNKILVAEWAKSPRQKIWKKLESMSDQILGVKGSDPISPDLGLFHGFPPHLEYAYPDANEKILTNIFNTMASVPKFYVQVLHLMNKMNLPPPFGSTLPIDKSSLKSRRKRKRDIMVESSESEISSEEEEVAKPAFVPIRRTAQPILHNPIASNTSSISSVLPLNIQVTSDAMIPKIGSNTSHMNVETTEMKLAENQIHSQHNANMNLNFPPRNVLSDEKLFANKLSEEQLLALPLHKDLPQDKGTPTKRLFVKNLHKNVLRSDLEFIFGRYFATDEDAAKGLDVNMMSGRMKGAAFISFPTVEQAQLALKEVSGYLLHEKPLIVLYGKKK